MPGQRRRAVPVAFQSDLPGQRLRIRKAGPRVSVIEGAPRVRFKKRERARVNLPGSGIDLRLGGPDIRVTKGKRGVINVHGAGGSAERHRVAMPELNTREFRMGIIKDKARHRRMVEKYLGGITNYEGFMNVEGKRDDKGRVIPWKSRSSFFGGSGSIADRKLRVVRAKNRGEVSLNPLNANFVLLHPFRTFFNTVSWLRNPRTKRAELRELEKSREVFGSVELKDGKRKVSIPQKLKLLEARYEALVNRLYSKVTKNYRGLMGMYVAYGEGKVSPEKFEIAAREFIRVRQLAEERIRQANANYTSQIIATSSALHKARVKAKLAA